MSNNQIHLTVKSVTKFAIANFPPLFTSSDFGVRQQKIVIRELIGYNLKHDKKLYSQGLGKILPNR